MENEMEDEEEKNIWRWRAWLMVTPLEVCRLQDKWANAATWEDQGTQDKTRCRRRQSSHNSLSIWVEFLYIQIPIWIVKDISLPFIGAKAGHIQAYSRSYLNYSYKHAPTKLTPQAHAPTKLTPPPSFYIFLN